MATDNPHGYNMGARFAPAWHRPWFRYVEPVDGAETPQETPKPGDTPADTTDWKAEARKWESRAKESNAAAKANEAAAKRLAEIEESQKTEVQKLQDRITAAEKAVADAEKRAVEAETARLRSDIATKHGISAEDRDLFLTGTDEAALTAQAKRLADRETDRKKNGNVAPKEGDAKNNDSKEDRELREFARNLFGAAD